MWLGMSARTWKKSHLDSSKCLSFFAGEAFLWMVQSCGSSHTLGQKHQIHMEGFLKHRLLPTTSRVSDQQVLRICISELLRFKDHTWSKLGLGQNACHLQGSIFKEKF